MFNLSGSEMVFLLLLALIILGPEKLPDAVRRFGKGYAEFKKMSSGFQSELKSALDEPMREMRETADAFKKAVNFDFDGDGDIDQDDADAIAAASAAAKPVVDEPMKAERPEPATEPLNKTTVDEETAVPDSAAAPEVAATDAPTPETAAAGNEPPLVRPPGPTFHSAAPQPKVVPAVEETASE
ncbi:MAG TPA: twin-arginine translocase TatA/TatE family subunit [Ilumatobacteraceae bacterium]|nr:twin-arginine translocase TatA/TatE family subunit [Ilumatobacteraceae bacterium]